MPQAHQIRDTLVLKSTGPLRGGRAVGEPQLYFLLPRGPGLYHLQPESGRSSGSGSAPGKAQSADAGVPTTERLPNQSESFEMARSCRGFQSRTVWGWRGKLPGTATALPVAGLAPLGTRERAGNLLSPSWRASRSASAGDPPSRGPAGDQPDFRPGVRGDHSG